MVDMKQFIQTLCGQNKEIGTFLKKTCSSGAASMQLVQQAKNREEKQQVTDKTIRRIFR